MVRWAGGRFLGISSYSYKSVQSIQLNFNLANCVLFSFDICCFGIGFSTDFKEENRIPTTH